MAGAAGPARRGPPQRGEVRPGGTGPAWPAPAPPDPARRGRLTAGTLSLRLAGDLRTVLPTYDQSIT
ncbi:hypothetical protein AB0A74_29365, partial [Saccharothrix sp. NPDC042600]|uniref:hypothetical protein n=1 Tax=Saccharothrix sp. NPDC042600 TaxID=3154492 RepID=UPI0033EAF3D5